jgi:hypothetical protein
MLFLTIRSYLRCILESTFAALHRLKAATRNQDTTCHAPQSLQGAHRLNNGDSFAVLAVCSLLHADLR